MAALTTLAIASLAASAVGTGVAIYGQQQAAKTAASVGDYNAKISKMTGDYNAAVSEQNAKQVADTSEYNAQVLESQALQTEMDARENIRRKRIENARYASTQRARFAASGVTEEGSPLEAMAETAALLEMDAQEVNRQAQINASRIRAGAAEERRQGLFQAGQYKQQAGFDRFYGFYEGWTDQYHPKLIEGNSTLPKVDKPGYHFSADMADHAIADIEDAAGKPFFLYFAPNAVHFPVYPRDEFLGKSGNGQIGRAHV